PGDDREPVSAQLRRARGARPLCMTAGEGGGICRRGMRAAVPRLLASEQLLIERSRVLRVHIDLLRSQSIEQHPAAAECATMHRADSFSLESLCDDLAENDGLCES